MRPPLIAALLVLLLCGTVPAARAGYLPLWIQQDRSQVIVEGRNTGLEWIDEGDSARTPVFGLQVQRILYFREGGEMPLVPGDTLLLLSRGTYMRPQDRERYVVLGVPDSVHARTERIVLRGQAIPCERFLPMFTRKPWPCDSTSVSAGGDYCSCVREAIDRHRELRDARARGEEAGFLLRCLRDPNPIVVASAMGILRLRGDPRAMEEMLPLARHPEVQVRYDLAESIPYLAGDAAGRAGLALLDDPDPNVQLLAAWGLGRMRSKSAAPALAAVLEDPRRNVMVRASCLDALDKMSSPLLLPSLEKAVAAGPDSVTAAGFRAHLERLRKAATKGNPDR